MINICIKKAMCVVQRKVLSNDKNYQHFFIILIILLKHKIGIFVLTGFKPSPG
jgi:hypothetical protein